MFHATLSTIDADLEAMRSANEAQYGVRKIEDALERVANDVERLLMITEGLWSILKEQHGYEDDELVRRILEIDNRDGRIDGKVAAHPPADCPSCNRPLSRDRRFCLYCGEPAPVELFDR